MAAPSQAPRAAPPLRRVILRITFVAPLWGVLLADLLLSAGSVLASVTDLSDGIIGLFGIFAFFLFAIIPSLIIGYPIGVVVAFLTALFLVFVVRRFGWSRRNAILTALAPGLLFAGLSLASSAPLLALGALVTCVGAAALTWWSSLRGLLSGTSDEVADVFS